MKRRKDSARIPRGIRDDPATIPQRESTTSDTICHRQRRDVKSKAGQSRFTSGTIYHRQRRDVKSKAGQSRFTSGTIYHHRKKNLCATSEKNLKMSPTRADAPASLPPVAPLRAALHPFFPEFRESEIARSSSASPPFRSCDSPKDYSIRTAAPRFAAGSGRFAPAARSSQPPVAPRWARGASLE